MRTASSLKQGEQEQVQSAGGYHLISNQENVEKKNEKTHNLKLRNENEPSHDKRKIFSSCLNVLIAQSGCITPLIIFHNFVP